jgi:hypothetical protein
MEDTLGAKWLFVSELVLMPHDLRLTCLPQAGTLPSIDCHCVDFLIY